MASRLEIHLNMRADILMSTPSANQDLDPHQKPHQELVCSMNSSDVIPDNLPSSLQSRREVHDVIEVIPGSSPPSWPTYPLSYKEMDDLKKQLADLSAPGFARPSKSPVAITRMQDDCINPSICMLLT